MLSDDKIEDKFFKFLHQHHELVNNTILEGKKSVIISFNDLDKFDVELTDQLLKFPEKTIEVMDSVLDREGLIQDGHVRFSNLPDSNKLKVKDIRSKHLGRLVLIDGIIRQASEVRPEVVQMIFECEECGNRTEMVQDEENTLKKPRSCFICGKRTRFEEVSKNFVDVQRIVMEERPKNLKGNEQPSRINCMLRDDLVDPELRDKLTPGKQINVGGIVKEVPITTRGGKQTKRFDIMLEANNVEPLVTEFEELKITSEEKEQIQELADDPDVINKIISSVAPSIYGFDEVKQGIALQLFGGIRKVRDDGVITRGDVHLLLVGDPGSGKSQLLKYVAKLSPKARYVTGKGATGAGITATVVKDEFLKGWALEAGALVLASGGIACIDELDKMSAEDRSAMHEAMEQQQISIAKANVQATLNAKAAVLGAANPKYGRFDPYQPIVEQIDMPDTLLSRFDLIFPIRDMPDKGKDSKLAEHILWLHKDPKGIKPVVSVELMRKYIAYARKKIHPTISEEAIKTIKSFFVGLRAQYSSEESQSVPVSPRQLEALVRLAEASAKMRLSEKANKEDAERAIELLKHCLYQVGMDPETGKLDIDRLEGVTTASKRGKIMVILKILKELEKELEGPVPKFDIINKAKEEGVPADAAEKLINEMKRKGDIYEPRSGFIQKL